MIRRSVYISLGVVALVVIVWLAWPAKKGAAPTVSNTLVNTSTSTANTSVVPSTEETRIFFSSADLPERDPAFEFSLSMLSSWRADYQSSTKAIVLYDPALSGELLQQTQVFVTAYTGTTFVTTGRTGSPVNTSSTIGSQPAHQYTYRATTAAVPSGFPVWWSYEHQVAEVQTGLARPFTYNVLHFAPTVSESERSAILNSFQLTNSALPI